MRIEILNNDRYYQFKVENAEGDNFNEVLEKCRTLKFELGYQKFTFSKYVRRWVFKKEVLTDVIKAFPTADIDKEIKDGYIGEVLEQKREEKAVEVAKIEPVPMELFDGVPLKPYEYQRQGIGFMWAVPKCWNNDEVRMGKLYQTAGLIHVAKVQSVFILCPNSTKTNWQRKMGELIYRDARIVENELDPNGINIVNYDRLPKFGGKEGSGKNLRYFLYDNALFHWDLIILDEAHRIKAGKKSIRGGLSMLLAEKADRVVCLTGTPMPNRPQELLAQIKVINRLDDFGGEWQYLKRYCDGKQKNIGKRKIWDFSGASNMAELNSKIAKFSIRRLQRDVWDDLPEETQNIEYLDLPEPKEYDALERMFNGELMQVSEFYTTLYKSLKGKDKYQRAEAILKFSSGTEYTQLKAQALVRIEKLKQEVARQKMLIMDDVLMDYIDNKVKLLFFTLHREFAQEMHKKYTNSVLIHGGMKDVQERIDRFQQEKDIQFAFVTMATANEGLDFSAADDVMFAELDWVPSTHEQCAGRVKNSEKRNPITVTYLVMDNTIESDIIDILTSKDKVIRDTFKSQNSVFKKILERLMAA